MSKRADDFIRTSGFCNELKNQRLKRLSVLQGGNKMNRFVYNETTGSYDEISKFIEKSEPDNRGAELGNILLEAEREKQHIVSYWSTLMKRIQNLFFNGERMAVYIPINDKINVTDKNEFFSFFVEYQCRGIGLSICEIFSLNDVVERIKKNFPLHSYSYYIGLLIELNEKYPELSEKINGQWMERISFSKEGELITWLHNKIKNNEKPIDVDFSRRTQYYNTLCKTIRYFSQKALLEQEQVKSIEYFKFCVKSKTDKELTLSQIESISKKFGSFIKKIKGEGKIFYARKISYDAFLGLQIDVLLLTKNLSRRTQLACYWQSLIQSTLDNVDIFYHYASLEVDKLKTNKSRTKEQIEEEISRFIEWVWRVSYLLDSHIKLELPTVKNFTKSR